MGEPQEDVVAWHERVCPGCRLGPTPEHLQELIRMRRQQGEEWQRWEGEPE